MGAELSVRTPRAALLDQQEQLLPVEVPARGGNGAHLRGRQRIVQPPPARVPIRARFSPLLHVGHPSGTFPNQTLPERIGTVVAADWRSP